MASNKTLKVTAVVENTANQRALLAEHGLAFWIERSDRRILFDTGQGLALAHNAEHLGIDLSTARGVVLSHGHYDHTGGLAAAISSFRHTVIYAHPAAFRERFVRHSNGEVRSVRSPVESFELLGPKVGRIVPTPPHGTELESGIRLTGEIPRRNEFEDSGGAFYLDKACAQADPIEDDQAVFVETGRGLVVLLGCAHAGIVNTLDHVCHLTGAKRIHAVLGGMHLLNASEDRLNRTIDRLRDLDVQRIGLAHCTGFAAMARLHRELPDRCFQCTAGTRIEFD